MTTLVFDIEADGLEATKIWCIVAIDTSTGESRSFGPDQLDEGLQYLQSASKLVGHNIIGYDLPTINRLLGIDLSVGRKVVDTLVLSRLFNPVREGGHGLESWGYRLKSPKIEHHEYDRFTPEMLKYCEQDVYLNYKLFNQLKLESKGFSSDSVALEHDTYRIINQQRDNGFLLDIKHATCLVAELNDNLVEAENEVHKTFTPKDNSIELEPLLTKTGKVSKMAKVVGQNKKVRLSDEEYGKACAKPDATFVRSDAIPFNLGSRKQIGEYLIEFGWKPKKHTPTGQPIVDETTLSKIDNIPEAKIIAKYLMLQKRLAQVNSWLKEVQDDDRVRGYVNANGTITGRMTHSNPNMAQVPSTNSPYGHECRACWTVADGYKLVGIDASGLELRMLAHYMNDEAFTYEILNGDVHTANQRAAGLESRNQAKTFIYALLYGAGDAKLGSVVGGNAASGKQLRQRFFDNLPSFKALKDRVSRASTKGWVKGLDGRKLFIRSEHAALNTLLQGAGAIVMKQAVVLFERKLKFLDAKFVCNVHDEWQLEVEESIAEQVGQLGVEAIREAGEVLKLRCDLDGEYKIGNNWAETH
jgi:DNA polymerase-1